MAVHDADFEIPLRTWFIDHVNMRRCTAFRILQLVGPPVFGNNSLAPCGLILSPKTIGSSLLSSNLTHQGLRNTALSGLM
jgi:hypothetical protein